MKLVIAGSRSINGELAYELIITALDHIIYTNEEIHVISGCARGIDSVAIEVAQDRDYMYSEYPADWEQYGKVAGIIRNKQMADVSDALLLIWDGESRGSMNMRTQMMNQHKPIFEIIINKENTL